MLGGKLDQHLGQIHQIAKLEGHIAGMAGGGRPEIRMAHGMDDCAIAAGRFAEDAAPTRPADAQIALHQGHHLAQQIILVAADGSAVDVLIAAQAAEAIGKCDGRRRHAPLADQSVETLRHVLAEILPIHMGLA